MIHSFWVPQLAGKTDLIPNRENTMWMDPREPGIYLGNCAEYCGTQHANMLLRVIAQLAVRFQRLGRAREATCRGPDRPKAEAGPANFRHAQLRGLPRRERNSGAWRCSGRILHT